MIFSPIACPLKWQAHATSAKTACGLYINVSAEDQTVNVRVHSPGHHGISTALALSDAEALALADELRAAVAAKTALKVAA